MVKEKVVGGEESPSGGLFPPNYFFPYHPLIFTCSGLGEKLAFGSSPSPNISKN